MRRRPGARARHWTRSVAAVAVASLGITTLTTLTAIPAAATSSHEPECLANPMAAATPTGSDAGYTLFVAGDAVLANSELEGTLAVGGRATFGDERGFAALQYPVFHGGVGGDDTYSTPTIDGEDNRVLVHEFAGQKVVHVQQRSAAHPPAGAKVFNLDSPAGYGFHEQFGGPGTTYYPVGGTNMSPQLESSVQPWADGAGAATFEPLKQSFTDYLPEDEGESIIAGVSDWKSPTVTVGVETHIALDERGPNRISLRDLTGAEKLTMSGYSETAPLVVEVTEADVADGTLTLPSYMAAGKDVPGAGDALSYLLWDLSALTGDVVLTSPNEPVRGAIYAPNAHVIFPPEADGGREFEGQLIAAQFTALQGGKEMHTNLFKGLLPCDVDPAVGGFTLEKVLDLPADTDLSEFAGLTFTVTASWTVDGTDFERSYDLSPGDAPVSGPQDLPQGTIVSFAEVKVPDVDGFDFKGVSFSPASLVITAGQSASVVASNAYAPATARVGGFSLSKVVTGPGAVLVPDNTAFQVDYFIDGAVEPDGRLSVTADGTVTDGPQTLPVGTVVTFEEVAPLPEVSGATWAGEPVFSPSEVTISENTSIVVTLTNTAEKSPVSEPTPTPSETPTSVPTPAPTSTPDDTEGGARLPATGGEAPFGAAALGITLAALGLGAILRVRSRRRSTTS